MTYATYVDVIYRMTTVSNFFRKVERSNYFLLFPLPLSNASFDIRPSVFKIVAANSSVAGFSHLLRWKPAT